MSVATAMLCRSARPGRSISSDRRWVDTLVCGAAAWLLIVAAGCGDADPRLAIRGTVSLDGRPLATGTVSLTPLAGGPKCGGKIADGRFEIEAGRGPVPGEYRVQIESWERTGERRQELDGEGTVERRRQIVPPKYNLDSELRVRIDAEHTEFEFDLTR